MPKACTQEAKKCPDGSFVSRTEPSCEFSACPDQERKELIQLANPASVYCEEQGGKLEIRNEEGGQSGYCHFSNGKECEEWSFYRRECEIE